MPENLQRIGYGRMGFLVLYERKSETQSDAEATYLRKTRTQTH